MASSGNKKLLKELFKYNIHLIKDITKSNTQKIKNYAQNFSFSDRYQKLYNKVCEGPYFTFLSIPTGMVLTYLYTDYHNSRDTIDFTIGSPIVSMPIGIILDMIILYPIHIFLFVALGVGTYLTSKTIKYLYPYNKYN